MSMTAGATFWLGVIVGVVAVLPLMWHHRINAGLDRNDELARLRAANRRLRATIAAQDRDRAIGMWETER